MGGVKHRQNIETFNQIIIDEIANEFAKNVESMCALDSNIAAMLTAQLLAEGKSKCELQNICHFLQLLTTALRTYML